MTRFRWSRTSAKVFYGGSRKVISRWTNRVNFVNAVDFSLKVAPQPQLTIQYISAGINRYKGGGDSFETSSSSDTVESPHNGAEPPPSQSNRNSSDGVYQWTLNNWGQRKRNNSGSVKVDLASPEDVTLDSDSTRVVFSTYGTTV